jgi:hypothetical protein
MKKIITKKIIPGILLIFGLFLLYHCQEEIISPNKNGSTVNLSIKGNKLNICKGDTVVTNAPFAQFAFVSKNGATLDTLFQGRLDAKGEWDTIYNIQLLGIPDIQVHGLLDLRSAVDSIHYLCCDDSFELNFKYDCNESPKVEVSCENLNDTINLTLTNAVGGEILLGTPKTDITGNKFQFDPTDNITVNMNEAKALNGDFTADVSPVADANGNIELGSGKQPLVINFFVKTDKAGEFTKSINLKTTCATGETGNIKINLKSVITDNDCSCPFSSDGKVAKELYPYSQSILLGETSPVSVNTIINVNEFTLGEGCFLVVDSIARYNSSVKVTELNKAGIQAHEWKLTAPVSSVELRNEITTFSMSTTFTPKEVGTSTDTFSVFVSIKNATGSNKDACSFLVSYSGDCCNNNICPSITKSTDLPADLIDGVDGTVIRKLGNGEKIEMGSGNNIKQTMDGLMGTLCTSFKGDNKMVSYIVTIPEIDSIVPCSDVTITVDKLTDGATDDRGNFSLVNSSFTVKEGGNSSFGVQFQTPDVKTHISSGHSAFYKAKLIVRAFDNTGEICSQQIDLEANVASKKYKISKSTNMKAFSQVSDKESSPSYAAYNIWEYNKTYQYYGQQDKLDPDKGTVNMNTNPPTPYTDHSFFFEVDEPTNLTLRQTPKLYLVSTPENKYSMISSQPIARYNNNTDFTSDLDQLMQDVFNSNFQSRGNAPFTSFSFNSTASEVMWSPSISAAQLAGAGNGLNIQLGEVYVIWNPIGTNEVFSSGGKTYNNYCDVAFLYIEGLFDGTGSTNNIGNVTFYVVYPLTTIIN